jgi:cell wall-associated NlpC family hydrolase
MAGLFVVGSSLYALSMLPMFMRTLPDAQIFWVMPHPVVRTGVPPELAWFFSKFPYLSRATQILPRTHHLFRIADPTRGRDYVVSFGQTFRRVEIYSHQEPEIVRVRIYTPGKIREVLMKSQAVTSDETRSDGNLWMWSRPLWNTEHIKIYGLTDLWLNAPFKKYSCAGFVHQFLADAGVHVPVLDAWDMARLPWTRVRIDEMEPGDIITIRAASRQHQRFWGHRITHVGVYVGNGKLIHASTASPNARRSFIRISDLSAFDRRIDKILRPKDLL